MKKLLLLWLIVLFGCTTDGQDDFILVNEPNIGVPGTPQYTLDITAGSGGSVTPTSGTYNSGIQVSVTATPNSGYTFSGWSNGSTVNPLSITMTSNTSITANFALIPVYTLTVSAEEGGSVSSEGGEYQQGTQVTLTATPDEGYEFSGWSDGSTEATRVITTSEDLTLTASFSELIISYTLTVTSQEGGSVNSEGGEYNEGAEITLTATASEGYRFTGWSNGFSGNQITIILNEDISLTASFELNLEDNMLLSHFKFDNNLSDQYSYLSNLSNSDGFFTSNRKNEPGSSYNLQGSRSSSNYIISEDIDKLKLEKFSYSIWVKFDQLNQYIQWGGPYDYDTFNPQVVFAINSNDWDIGPAISLSLRNDSSNRHFFRYYQWTQNGVAELNSDFKNIEIGTWYNLVVTYDSNIAKLYLNGELIGQNNMPIDYQNQYDLTIGGQRNGTNMIPMGALHASVDDFKIYNYPLNLNEISEINSIDNTNQFTVEISANQGGNISSNGGIFNQGDSFNVTATPFDGYIFTGWSNGSNENPLTILVNQDITLQAQFQTSNVDSNLIAENGVTIIAPISSNIGDKYFINGEEYTVVSEMTLRNMINNEEDLSKIITSKIVNMERLFEEVVYSENMGSIISWDVSNVINMKEMFKGTFFFNQAIGSWDVSNVQNMRGMFNNNDYFNQDISSWNVSKVENMWNMFYKTELFNQDISSWDVSNVTNMRGMFDFTEKFNQDISSWDVSGVTDMFGMFQNSLEFNQDISSWNVSNVEIMGAMFRYSKKFNQNLSGWNVNNVVSCSEFSKDALEYNLPKPNFTNCSSF